MLGKGYRVNMVCDKENVQTVKKLMKSVVPDCKFQESSGSSGGMVFDLPVEKSKQLGVVFSLMETQKSPSKEINELKSLVCDVGVSQTTLEEVFMAVTSH